MFGFVFLFFFFFFCGLRERASFREEWLFRDERLFDNIYIVLPSSEDEWRLSRSRSLAARLGIQLGVTEQVGRQFGSGFRRKASCVTVEKISKNGLIASQNAAAAPGRQLRVHDKILAVNGVQGSAPELIKQLKARQSSSVLDLDLKSSILCLILFGS